MSERRSSIASQASETWILAPTVLRRASADRTNPSTRVVQMVGCDPTHSTYSGFSHAVPIPRACTRFCRPIRPSRLALRGRCTILTPQPFCCRCLQSSASAMVSPPVLQLSRPALRPAAPYSPRALLLTAPPARGQGPLHRTRQLPQYFLPSVLFFCTGKTTQLTALPRQAAPASSSPRSRPTRLTSRSP